MSVKSHVRLATSRLLIIGLLAMPAVAQTLDGIWDATVTVNDVAIPFRIEFSSNGSTVQSYFFNGDDRANPSSQGTFRDGLLALRFDSYATRLDANLRDGTLVGSYEGGPGSSYPFEAKRHQSSLTTTHDSTAPNIDGNWEIQVKSPKGESAWHLVLKQSATHASATILRVDGDTGTLAGDYRDGKFVLSHFTGERPFLVEVTPIEDGSLRLVISNYRETQTLIAVRPDLARAKGLLPPDDPAQHTRLKNPSEPLRFSFPDIDGQTVSNTDARFRKKVVLVNVTGSWCPNCHDEAPFLELLYRKYHDQGLEIVALDFEPAEQLKDLSRLRAFIRRYGIEYTYLIAGEPGQLNEKIPQAENLNAWPTTFFVGRDGLVHGVHTGFTSQASGTFDSDLRERINGEIVQLLSANVQTARTNHWTQSHQGNRPGHHSE